MARPWRWEARPATRRQDRDQGRGYRGRSLPGPAFFSRGEKGTPVSEAVELRVLRDGDLRIRVSPDGARTVTIEQVDPPGVVVIFATELLDVARAMLGLVKGYAEAHPTCPNGHPRDEKTVYRRPGHGSECSPCRAARVRETKARARLRLASPSSAPLPEGKS